MKKLLTLAVLMLVMGLALAQNTKKVAILEVVDREGQLNYNQKLILRSNMARAVANTSGYEAYERSDMDVIMSEQNFQRTGLVSDEEIRKLGEMTGVSLILVTEGVLTGSNQIFVSAKILNVETAKVEMMDNLTMGLDPSSMQEGCTTLAKRLFGSSATTTAIEKYSLTRMGPNEYIYMGKYLEKHEYEYFLKNNCPKAYGQYKVGKQLIAAGWGVFAAGLAIGAGGAAMVGLSANNNNYDLEIGGIVMLSVGPSVSTVVGVPLLCVGYSKRNKAYQVYNNSCASSAATPLTFHVISGKNGIGLAMQF